MRILFCPAHYVYDDTREGSELAWSYNIADRISSIFPDSVVVTGRSTVGSRRYRIVEVTPGETRLNFGLRHALAFNTRYTLAAFRGLRSDRFDIVHHVLPFALGRTYNFAVLRHGSRTPFVIGPVQSPLTVRDTDVEPTDLRSYGSQDESRLASLERLAGRTFGAFLSAVAAPLLLSRVSARTLSGAAAVVAVNEQTRVGLIEIGVCPERVVVISPGVDSQRFQPATSSATDPAGVVVLSVSNLVNRKNVDVIIQAFAKVLTAAPLTRLRIVGDGPQRAALDNLARALGVRESITFTGSIPHATVHEEYRRADVFVNASAAEGFSTTCLEALASGLPVLSTKVGGFADVVEDHRNGYLIDRADSAELAAKLLWLVENPTSVAQLSIRARAIAERDFDWDTAVIPKYLDLYGHVSRERAPREASRRWN